MTTKIKSGVIAAGAVDANALSDNSITIAHLNCSDGTNGQVLTTNGSGTLSFTDMTGGVDGIVSSADATAITIDSSEKVGLNKVPSTWHLDVNSSDVYVASFDGSNDKGVIINSEADSGDIIGYSNSTSTYNPLNIRGATGVGLYIDTSNRVGIGTSNPDVKLEVAGASGSSSTFKLSGRPDWTSGDGQYNVGNIYGENLGAGVNTTRIKLDVDDTSGIIQFFTASSGTLTSAMIINSDQDITMSGTGSVKIPSGTTAQSPSSPTAGMTRYNT